jgi:Holliday junction resolvasome RuvABC endonuclease subunit
VIVVGFDPSTEGTAWAMLDIQPKSRKYLDCGRARDDEAIVDFFDRFVGYGFPTILVAVETPGHALHIHHEGIPAARARASCLIATARVAGFISGRASARGLLVYEVTPERWRSLVIGLPSPQDVAIKAAITRLVVEWPAKSNSHVRDAAGVALGAELLHRAPPRVRAAVRCVGANRISGGAR